LEYPIIGDAEPYRCSGICDLHPEVFSDGILLGRRRRIVCEGPMEFPIECRDILWHVLRHPLVSGWFELFSCFRSRLLGSLIHQGRDGEPYRLQCREKVGGKLLVRGLFLLRECLERLLGCLYYRHAGMEP